MKRNSEFYQVVLKISYESLNVYRIAECNNQYQAEKNFEEMEKAIKQKNKDNWTLTLQKQVNKHSIQIIKIRSATEPDIDSPLF